MVKETTNTSGRNLAPEGHYDLTMVQKVVRKNLPSGYVVYEWTFEAEIDDNPIVFKIGLFASQMGELLRALKCKEVKKDEFEWDTEEIAGEHLSFNIVHVEDKKGIIRENVVDVVAIEAPKGETKKDADVAWDE